ncbi:MAG: preprotein translocase subunit SecE [Ignavibacteriales bacterium]|nr:MAG: preprotein translocase subunit SecE [Ignavibacteriaceae bacterium]MBW7873044.1 preprotein translocase subunit SecE [Ignavibacteria bacterium]MCZ2142687.1 preprotein translocase subunit SecE [Ignavibacteriales bacterium]OQY71317.1 MAG: preprotein translocase subunit SecE [Ignavibacteriales bacterium UTCHB3]MBZ0196376.1 preprotein translocase subunit SecE [Ignavibacteriaceae bacterium]
MKQKIIKLYEDIVKEMKKVTWPTRPELKASTTVVIISSLVFAVLCYVIDQGVNYLVSFLY